MCEKASTCGCTGGSPGVGSAPLWAPLWVVGAAIAVVLVVKTAEVVWPYALAGAVVLAAGKVALWQRRRRVIARTVPLPDPVLVAAPARTRVENVTVLPVAGTGMGKAPSLNWAGRGHAGKTG